MLNEIYNKEILRYAADIHHIGKLEDPGASATAHSKLCGSKVRVDVSMQDGVVSEFAQDVKACALGQASSSIMSRHVIGSSGDELRRVREEMYAMLKDGGAAPNGKWSDLKILAPVKDFKARHASTLLTFDAVCEAVSQIEAAEA
ncbi:MAG: iron-sulfur cluster assembly scaffold protein [Pseudomonadota bacterium]